jgi:hypothetical protein
MPTPRLIAWGIYLLPLIFVVAPSAFGGVETDKIFAARAEKEFLRAQAQFESHTNDSAAAWQFSRASFDLADCATNETQRADIAKLGIAASRQLLDREPKSAPGHYYLAMDQGELAQAEAPSIAAYKLVKEIEREFKTAADLDEQFDYAGPARNLGLLYRDAPGWPLSIGGKRKAAEWLERAAAIAPAYPENQLNLAETQLKWRLRDDTEKTLKNLDSIWPAAQTNFAGAAWESSWRDWIARRGAVKAEFARVFKGESGH